MKAKWLPISAAVALALGSVSASAMDFHGYMRAGLSYSAQGGNTYCTGNGGGSAHVAGRLGDECDTYGEFIFSQEVFNKANNKFTVHGLVAYQTPETNYDLQGNSMQDVGGSGPWNGQRLSFREAYVDYEMPSGITLWAGKRYYKRKDIPILDYMYLNASGYGVGVENIGLGNKELGTVSVALRKGSTAAGYTDWVEVDAGHEQKHKKVNKATDGTMSKADAYRNSYIVDVRWDGIQMWENASLDIALLYGWENLSDNQKSQKIVRLGDDGKPIRYPTNETLRNNTGFMAMVEYTQGNFFGGFNKMSVSYGHNGFSRLGIIQGGSHEGGYVAPDTRGNGWRFIDWGVIEQDKWNLGYSLVWSHFSPRDKDGVYEGWKGWGRRHGNEFSLVVRPAYKWSDFTSTVLEAGYYTRTNFSDTEENSDKVKSPLIAHKQHKSVSLTKITLAQQWSPMTHFFARPSIRVFASLVNGSLMDKEITGYKKDNHEWVFGAQVEAWW